MMLGGRPFKSKRPPYFFARLLQISLKITDYLCPVMKILIVEDEKALRENILSYFSNGEIVCEMATNYEEAQEKLIAFSYDVLVLDLMLPDGDGLNLLRLLKKLQPETGVLIISAKNSLEDRVNGLELGADDYLTKPFHMSELNARLKAIFRRRKLAGQTTIDYEEISIDTNTHDVMVKDNKLTLTVKEYELLLFMVSNKNRVLTKQIIAEHLWGDNVDFLDSFDFVYQHIKNLRKKITAAGGNDYIKTIYGLGYKLSS